MCSQSWQQGRQEGRTGKSQEAKAIRTEGYREARRQGTAKEKIVACNCLQLLATTWNSLQLEVWAKMACNSKRDKGGKKNPNAVAMGKKGSGSPGGKARAKKLSPARKKEIARQGGKCRMAKKGGKK